MKPFHLFKKYKISGTTVKLYFDGKFLLWCKHHAPEKEIDDESEFMNLLARNGVKHEEKAVNERYPGLKEIYIESKDQILKEMKKGPKALCQFPIFSDKEKYSGFPDLLVKKKGKSKLGNFHYVVKEIKSAKDIRKAYYMQTAFYNYVLGKLQGYTPEKFYVINGEDEEIEYDYAKYENALLESFKEIKDILNGKKVLPAINTGYPWKDYSEKLARKTKDITLVQGVSEGSREKFISEGFKTIKSIANASEEELQVVKGVGSKTAIKVKSSAQAWIKGKPIIFGKPEFRKAKIEIFFDLETAKENEELGVDEVSNYLFGMLIRNGKEEFIPFVAASLKEEKKALYKFLNHLKKLDDFVMYVYSSYERGQFVRMFEQYKVPKKLQMLVLDNLEDLLVEFKKCAILPTIDNGLKAVAKYLGFKWRQSDVTGDESMAMYLKYEETGDKEILQKIIVYNEADVIIFL